MDPAASARFRPAEPASHPSSALPPYAGARDDAIALLRVAGLDTQLDRLRRSLAELLQPLERLRSDLEALADLVEGDRPREATRESGEAREARRRRLLSNQSMHTELAEALKRDEENVFAMSSELQRKTAGVAQEREAALACFPSPLRERYEASVRNGQEPALVALHDGRCPGCSQTLPEASRRLVEENLLVVPCSGCHRLLCDRGWTERDFMPARLRSVPGARP